jgi:hypothetical protein
MRAVHCEHINSRDSEYASENEDAGLDQEQPGLIERSAVKSHWVLGKSEDKKYDLPPGGGQNQRAVGQRNRTLR